MHFTRGQFFCWWQQCREEEEEEEEEAEEECWLSLPPEPRLPWNTNVTHQIFSNMILQLCMVLSHLYSTDGVIFPGKTVCLLIIPHVKMNAQAWFHRLHVSESTCITIDLFGVYLYTVFAQAENHMEPEMQVCKCMNMWTVTCVCVALLAVSTSLSQSSRLLSADKSVQIFPSSHAEAGFICRLSFRLC